MKRPVFTPESLFRVSTLGIRDPLQEPCAAVGAHLRAWVNPGIGFPLRGITFLPLRRDALNPDGGALVRPLRVHWWVYDDNGTPRSLGTDHTMRVTPDRPLYGDIAGPIDEGDRSPWISWIRLDAVGSLRLAVVGRSAGQQDRILLSRSQHPYALAASRIRRIRLTGDAEVSQVIGVDASLISRGYLDPTGAVIQLALPLDHPSPWAAPVVGFDGGMHRVRDGAPRHTGPPDLPVDTATPNERARVDMLLRDRGDMSVAALLNNAYGDPGAFPGRHLTRLTVPGPHQSATADLATIQTLITAAADPGIARWLGLSAHVSASLADDAGFENELAPLGWIAVGMWAADPAARVAAGVTVDDVCAAMHATGTDVTDLLRWAPPAKIPIDDALIGGLGLVRMSLATPALIGALPDPPDAPALAADGPGQWVADNTYRQDIAILGPPPPGPIAFTRTVAGITRTQHDVIDVNGTERGLTLLPGRRELLTGCQGALVDSSVPADHGAVSWQVAVGDEFGRWGAPGVLDATVPPRPELPWPRPEAHFFADYGRRDAPAGQHSPGTITVEVDVPPPGTLGPGTLPITRVSISGAPDVNAPFPGDRVRVRFPAAPLNLGEFDDQTLTVTFNPQGPQPKSTQVSVHVVDPRRPAPVPTAPRLLWSARRDPVGASEVDLSWAAAPGHGGYNVYLADEQIVSAQLGVRPDSPNRATRAAALHAHCNALTRRESFTLLTSAPLPAAGTVRFTHRLPGSLRTLQFIRVVPLSPARVEAPFNDCGLTPVAVPGDDAPPAPVVIVGRDGDGPTVRVHAPGINAAVLQRLGSAAPPEYRVRCCSAAASSYLYGVTIDEGPLSADGQPDAFRATVPGEKLAVLPPFVALSLTAQVRYPAEVSTKPGAAALPSPIVSTAGLVDGQPCEWSDPSTPAAFMTTTPTPDLHATVTADGAGRTLSFDGLPAQHPQQIAPWRIRLWRRRSDGSLQWLDASDADLTVQPATPGGVDGWEFGAATWGLRDTHPDVLGYSAVLVNPLGEVGPLTEFAAG